MHSNTSKTQCYILLIILILPIFLTGCIQIESEVYLNADGSGKITVIEKISGTGIDVLSTLGGSGGLPDIDITGYFTNLDKEQMTREVKKVSKGIEFSNIEGINLEDGTLGRKTTYTFSDINAVSLFVDNNSKNTLMSFEYSSNTLKILTSFTKPQEVELMDNAKMLEDVPFGMKSFFDGFYFGVILKTEVPIKSTNAHYLHSDHKGITFLDVDLGRLIVTPEAIEAISSYNSDSPDSYYTALEPYEWLSIEYQKEITINF